MRLLLIRHGETVDNAAGLYAGVRDSALTIHGVEQARRLGEYLDKTKCRPTHIFASPLQRAYKTAEALVVKNDALAKTVVGKKSEIKAVNETEKETAIETNSKTNLETESKRGSEMDLKTKSTKEGETKEGETKEVERKPAKVEIVKVNDLIEQDFGSYEGKPFGTKPRPYRERNGKVTTLSDPAIKPGFVDVESKDSLAKRANLFLDLHLVPLIRSAPADEDWVVAVVSHGILLSSLWRRLSRRIPKRGLSIASEVMASRGEIILDHLGGWSNTGYLELELNRERSWTTMMTMTTAGILETIETADKNAVDAEHMLHDWRATVLAIDSKQHLGGLKRQRGGIGRMAHDSGQMKLDSFFKRRRVT